MQKKSTGCPNDTCAKAAGKLTNKPQKQNMPPMAARQGGAKECKERFVFCMPGATGLQFTAIEPAYGKI
jgi:hypothetical protein